MRRRHSATSNAGISGVCPRTTRAVAASTGTIAGICTARNGGQARIGEHQPGDDRRHEELDGELKAGHPAELQPRGQGNGQGVVQHVEHRAESRECRADDHRLRVADERAANRTATATAITVEDDADPEQVAHEAVARRARAVRRTRAVPPTVRPKSAMAATIAVSASTVTSRPASTTPRWRIISAVAATLTRLPADVPGDPQRAAADDLRTGLRRVEDVRAVIAHRGHAARSSASSVSAAVRSQSNSAARRGPRSARRRRRSGSRRSIASFSTERTRVRGIDVLRSVAADLRKARSVRRQDRRARGQRLENGKPEALAERRVAEHGAVAVERSKLFVRDDSKA